MGEKQGRPVNLADEQQSGGKFRRPQVRPRAGRHAMRGLVLGASAMLGLLVIPAGLVRAQDTPVKNEAAAKSEAPRQPAPDSPAQEAGTAQALSLRYRFIERYSANEDPNHPELLTQYQVGLIESQKTEREKQQGAPDRSQISHRTIYTERTAEATKIGELTSAVRRYDRFKMDDLAASQRAKVPYFEGLTILYKLQPARRPLIVNLTDDRPLRQLEYSRMTAQVFMPRLTALLPQTPRLVADTWPIPARAAQCLVGEMPSGEDYDVTGTLVEVHKAGEGPALTAVIGIAGQMNLPSFGASSLNAQIHFVFNPVAAVPPAAGSGATRRPGDSPASKGGNRPEPGVVTARGYISRVLMAWKATNLLPDEEARLKLTRTYELQLERRLASANNAIGGGPKELLQVPLPIPAATEANSWLLYQDPADRFYLLHPQNLELSPRMIDPNVLELVEQEHGTGKDVFMLTLAPGATEPQEDKDFREVNKFQRKIDDYWAKMKVDTLKGPAGWLPEAEWSPWKVFRKELGIKAGGGEDQEKAVERIYCDDYLVLSKRNECFHAQSMTIRTDHVVFRTQSEGIIKSFHFGKWDPKAKAPATAPAAPPLTPAN
jgi:hypothetical protein